MVTLELSTVVFLEQAGQEPSIEKVTEKWKQ